MIGVHACGCITSVKHPDPIRYLTFEQSPSHAGCQFSSVIDPEIAIPGKIF